MLAEFIEERGGQRTGLQDCYTVVLEHVQKRCFSGIVKAEKKKLCVLVGEAERGQKVEDCVVTSALCRAEVVRRSWSTWSKEIYIHLQIVSLRSVKDTQGTYQLTIHMLI